MAKKVKFITPPGVAVYPWLTKADAKFGDPKFKVKLRLDPKDVAKVTAQVKELAKEGRYKVKTPQLPITETEDGTLLSFSSKFMPTIMDAKNNKIVDKFNLPSPERLKDIRVGGGSIIRVSAEPYYYDKGMSFQLAAVQVIKLEKGE